MLLDVCTLKFVLPNSHRARCENFLASQAWLRRGAREPWDMSPRAPGASPLCAPTVPALGTQQAFAGLNSGKPCPLWSVSFTTANKPRAQPDAIRG